MLVYKSQILPDFNIIIIENTDKYYDRFQKLFRDLGVAFVDAKQESIFVDGNYIFENDWFEKQHLDFIEAHEAAHIILGHTNSKDRSITEERDADYLAILILQEMGNKRAAKLGKDEFLTRNGLLFESAEKLIQNETRKVINEFLIPDDKKKLIAEQIVISEGRISDMKEKYPNVPKEVFNLFVQKDPSGNQKYLNWMLNAYTNVWNKPTSFDEQQKTAEHIIDTVTGFHENAYKITDEIIKKYMSWRDPEFGNNPKILKNPKDLYSYPTNNSVLILLVDKLREQPTKVDIKNIIKNETDKILNTSEWTVIVPKTHASSCLYGANTRWCTASKHDPAAFNDYISKGTIFYVINHKTNEKTAVFVRQLGNVEIYDEEDKPTGNNLPEIVWNAIIKYCKDIIGYDLNTMDKNQITTIGRDEDFDLDTLIDFENEF